MIKGFIIFSKLNKFKFELYSYFYDIFVNNEIYLDSYKKQAEELNFRDNTKILIIGVGTGIGLQFLTRNCKIDLISCYTGMISANNANQRYASNS
jgi:hypothetical protein